MSKHYLFFLVFCFHFSAILVSQEREKKQPLSQILPVLESRYNTTFTYADEVIKNVTSFLPDSALTLQEALQSISFNNPIKCIVFKETVIIQASPISTFSNQQLGEVLISHYLARGIDLQTDGDITISPKDFTLLPGLNEPDVLQSIKSLPGITSTDESITNLNIRGGTNDQNLLLWEGIRMWQSGHFFGMISAFDPYIIDKIKVSKNGTSARLGDGVSGTIDMSLDTQINKKVTANAGLNFIQASGLVKIPFYKNLELQLSARRALTDVLESVTYLIYFDRVFNNTEVNTALESDVTTNQAFYFYDVSGKVLYKPSKKDKLSFSFLAITNELNFTETANNVSTRAAINSGLSQTNSAASVFYKRTWDDNFFTTATAYVSNYVLNGINADVSNNQILTQENEVIDTGVRLENRHKSSDKLQYLYGYQFNEIGISNSTNVNRPPFFSLVKNVLQSHAGYGEVHFRDTKNRTHITGGLRTTYYPSFDHTYIEPRLSVNYTLANGLETTLQAEAKHQTSTQIIELPNDFLGIERRRWVLANENDIPVITSNQVSLGLQYSKNKWTVSAEGYYKNVEGITARSQGFLNQFQFVTDTGEFRVKGIDFLVQKRFAAFRSWLGYSYSKNDYTFTTLNNNNPFPNNVDVRHNFTFNNTYSKGEFHLGLGLNWYSGIPTTAIGTPPLNQNQQINFSTPNGARIDDFFRADLSATYNLSLGKKNKATVGLSLWNILNQRQTILQYYREIDGDIVSFEQESLGLTPNLSVRVFF